VLIAGSVVAPVNVVGAVALLPPGDSESNYNTNKHCPVRIREVLDHPG